MDHENSCEYWPGEIFGAGLTFISLELPSSILCTGFITFPERHPEELLAHLPRTCSLHHSSTCPSCLSTPSVPTGLMSKIGGGQQSSPNRILRIYSLLLCSIVQQSVAVYF